MVLLDSSSYGEVPETVSPAPNSTSFATSISQQSHWLLPPQERFSVVSLIKIGPSQATTNQQATLSYSQSQTKKNISSNKATPKEQTTSLIPIPIIYQHLVVVMICIWLKVVIKTVQATLTSTTHMTQKEEEEMI